MEKSRNLSDVQRQKILAFLIENNIIDKNGIVNYLESFILLRKYNRNMKLAIDKWKRDIDFVLRYKMNNSKITGVNENGQNKKKQNRKRYRLRDT